MRKFGRCYSSDGPLGRESLGRQGVADSLQNQELGERYPSSATGVAIAFKDGFAGKELRVLIGIASFLVTVSSAAGSSVKAAAG